MRLTFGKHKGEDSHALVVKDPSYVLWALDEGSSSGPLAALVKAINQHLRAFDAKPFTARCSGDGCTRPVVQATGYVGLNGELGMYLDFWCEGCDPHGGGAVPGRLWLIGKYSDFLHLLRNTRSTQVDGQRLMKQLAKAKGLGRLTEAALDAFFYPS